MLEIVLLVVGLSVGFIIGWRAREIHAQNVLNNMFKNQDLKSKEEIMNVEIVKDNDHFYVYSADTSAFIVQVKDKEQLFEYFKDKYPQKTVMMKKEHFALFDNAS